MNGHVKGADPVLDLARRYDRERLLVCLFAPPGIRSRLAALVLLHAEFARIPELVREPMAGLVRYQWWRERIRATARGAAAEHPALDVLAADLREGRVAADALLDLLEAQEALFEAGGLAGTDALEDHARRTSGRLQRLLALVSTEGREEPAAAEEVGTAYGLVGLLRAAPRLARFGIAVLPEPASNARSVRIAAVRERARRRLSALAPAIWQRLDPPSRLLARLTLRQLRALAAVGDEPARLPRHGDPLLPLRLLLWQRRQGRPPRL